MREWDALQTPKIKCLIVNECDRGVYTFFRMFQNILESSNYSLGGPQTILRCVQPILDRQKHLVFLTTNISSLAQSTFEPRFNDRLTVQLKMEMTPDIQGKILDRNLLAICPSLTVPEPVREALLSIASTEGLRRMLDTIMVSASRSMADGHNILFVYPLL